MKLRPPVAAAALVAVVVAASVAAGALARTSGTGVTVIARGLNNPRGLAVGPDGALYVAEAGRAGRVCFGKAPEQTCFGLTSSITRIAEGRQTRIAGGLASIGGKDGSFTVGIDDVAVAPDGTLYGIMTSAPPKDLRGVPAGITRQVGKLFRFNAANGRRSAVAQIDRFEVRNNPDGTDVNPNPYSVAIGPSGPVVLDAGGNTLLAVDASGNVSLLAIFTPQRFKGKRVHSVPTTVAVGPDGAYYVGELGGEGTPNGRSRIWRVAPGQQPAVFGTGFTTIVGLDFAPDGSLYVVELLRNGFAQLERGNFAGRLTRIAPDGSRSELARGRILAPGGVAIGADGTVYVSINSLLPGRGQVLRISS